MTNMGYCMFENTVNDLFDCKEQLNELGVRGIILNASEYEAPKVKQLIELCKEIVDKHGDDV
jgi:hypothetical protein